MPIIKLDGNNIRIKHISSSSYRCDFSNRYISTCEEMKKDNYVPDGESIDPSDEIDNTEQSEEPFYHASFNDDHTGFIIHHAKNPCPEMQSSLLGHELIICRTGWWNSFLKPSIILFSVVIGAIFAFILKNKFCLLMTPAIILIYGILNPAKTFLTLQNHKVLIDNKSFIQCLNDIISDEIEVPLTHHFDYHRELSEEGNLVDREEAMEYIRASASWILHECQTDVDFIVKNPIYDKSYQERSHEVGKFQANEDLSDYMRFIDQVSNNLEYVICSLYRRDVYAHQKAASFCVGDAVQNLNELSSCVDVLRTIEYDLNNYLWYLQGLHEILSYDISIPDKDKQKIEERIDVNLDDIKSLLVFANVNVPFQLCKAFKFNNEKIGAVHIDLSGICRLMQFVAGDNLLLIQIARDLLKKYNL